jgi:hypothetical protein
MSELVELPSHRVLSLEARPALSPRKRRPAAPLFSEMLDLIAHGDLTLREEGESVDVASLALADFHALRAICTRLGWLAEEPMEITCRNCGVVMSVKSCEAFPLGPFIDRELRDPELDATLDLSVRHPIAPVALPDGRLAGDVHLLARTAEEAFALHRALRRRRLVVSDLVVRAIGIGSIGAERDPARIADVLTACSNDTWDGICELFLRAHYPPRLRSVVVCSQCQARNDVDAPYEREFEVRGDVRATDAMPFPGFDEFSRAAEAFFDDIGGPLVGSVRLIVDDGVAACDEGGEPLLGAYVPPDGDPQSPVGAGEITVFYRTFRAAAAEDRFFDWSTELEETVDHELRHHEGWRLGYDPTDDSERDEVAREQVRVLGRGAVVRGTVSEFTADVGGFVVRAWPLVAIVALAAVATVVCSK